MKCENVRDLLGAYCAGELDAEERASVGRHLLGCAACEKEHRKMAVVINALGGFEAIEPSAGFMAGVWERIDAYEARRRVFWVTAFAAFLARNRRLVATGGVAFAISLLAGIYGVRHMTGMPAVEVATQPSMVSEGFVMREIPQRAEPAADTVYTHFVTGDRPVQLTSQPQTYIYNQVGRPTSEAKVTF
jgi:anti-sigma factor RsiW